MSHHFLRLGLVLGLCLHSVPVLGDDDDEDVKGPLMPTKPDGGLYNTAELINERKYKGETHSVTTEDGYVLTLYRVAAAKLPASAVILQHGYLASSDSWVTDPEALAFKLSDAGFDVWINNVRGNCYSRNHTKLNPNKDKEYWDFSWHEMGTKDVPAVIDYVLKTTGQPKVHYIGHSMGNTMSFVMTSMRPEYNAKLKSLVGLSPVVFLSKLNEMLGPDGMVEDMAKKYMEQFKASKKWEVFPRKDLATNNETQITCEDVEENFRDMCYEKMEMAQGVLGGAYLPAGQSVKTMNHFYQMSVAGTMRRFKYDSEEENKKAYGSAEPPPYTDNFSKISAPTLLWSADADGLVMPKDVDDLKPLLPNVVADNRIMEECFDHVSFLFPRKIACIPVRQKLYKEIIEAIQKLDKN